MADNGNLKAQQSTYNGMIGLLKWGAIVSILVAFGVLWLIAG
jgi:hypothetical protein